MTDLLLAMLLDAAVLLLVSTTVYVVHGPTGLLVLLFSVLLSTYLTLRGIDKLAKQRREASPIGRPR